MTAAQKSTALRTSNIGKDDIPLSSDDVFSHVYQAILDRRLPPGTKLREVPLAELFGVTRGTIRKAFTQLANQKVIDLIPNRGASVAYPTVEESRDLFAARRTIESAIVEQLTSRVTKSQIRELNAMVKRENAAYDKGDTREALKLSVDFHRVLATMAGNSVYADFLEQLVTRTPLVVLAYRDPAQATACANQDHQDLVTAIAAGDSVRAINTMRCHLCNLEGQLDLKNSTPSSELAAIFGLNAVSHRNAKRNLQ
ncbi:MAG: GntR family transcriptional regulator [Betaproteobacteria bacterium]|nr:GntR family transcriptional regulator [Betaproteobacteria bacterium]